MIKRKERKEQVRKQSNEQISKLKKKEMIQRENKGKANRAILSHIWLIQVQFKTVLHFSFKFHLNLA